MRIVWTDYYLVVDAGSRCVAYNDVLYLYVAIFYNSNQQFKLVFVTCIS
jgi:hypothetical protein